MNVEVNKLEGVFLDYFAGLANGYHVHIEKHQRESYHFCVRNNNGILYDYNPSEDIEYIGAIIEANCFDVIYNGDHEWEAGIYKYYGTGDTLVKAVCRGLVRKDYGNSVDIPVEYLGIYEESLK